MSIAVTRQTPTVPRAATTPAAAAWTHVSSAAFDWTVTILCAVFLGGGVLDGWAHRTARQTRVVSTPVNRDDSTKRT